METTTKILIVSGSSLALLGLSIYIYNTEYKPVIAKNIIDNLKDYKNDKKAIDFSKGVNYYYDKKGNILKIKNNEESTDFIFVNNQKIDLFTDELGYLIRCVYGEAGNVTNEGKIISYNAKLAVAEVVKNRVKTNYGGYKNYIDIIEKTGFDATKKDYYKNPKNIYPKHISYVKRFLECIKVSIIVFYNRSETSQGSIFFCTPAMLNKTVSYKGYEIADVKGVDKYYEFTFFKPIK